MRGADRGADGDEAADDEAADDDESNDENDEDGTATSMSSESFLPSHLICSVHLDTPIQPCLYVALFFRMAPVGAC